MGLKLEALKVEAGKTACVVSVSTILEGTRAQQQLHGARPKLEPVQRKGWSQGRRRKADIGKHQDNAILCYGIFEIRRL